MQVAIKEKVFPLILIVDDESAICESLSGVLSDESYRTITASDGPEGVAMAAEFQPDLIFLDIWMPGWDGIETLEKLKLVSPNSAVIVISGHATISNALEATKRGAFDFIEKPLDLDSILLAVRRALGSENSTESYFPPVFTHETAFSTRFAGKNIGQRTLKKGTILYGHCLHSGQKSGLVLEPLPHNSGIHFARIGDSRSVPADVRFVESTGFATTLKSPSGLSTFTTRNPLAVGAQPITAATIEHLLSALHAYRITNLLIKCNGEVPIFDGSASEFCSVIEKVGITEQEGDWYELVPPREYNYSKRGTDGSIEKISIAPADKLTVTYELIYPEPVGRQVSVFNFDGPQSFRNEIAPARTFGFMRDIDKLQRAGLARGGRLNNFILIGDDKVINTELRFPDELARHKILDAIGDLFLLSRPLRAEIKATMTGHSENVEILSLIRKDLV